MEKRLMEITTVWSKINGYYNQWVQDQGIKSFQAQILLALLVDSDMTQKEISEKYQMPKQSVNNIIHALLEEGLVHLEQSAQDNRKKIVVLIDAGQKYAEKVVKPFEDLDTQVFACMGKRSLQHLLDGLMAYEAALRKVVQKKVNEH